MYRLRPDLPVPLPQVTVPGDTARADGRADRPHDCRVRSAHQLAHDSDGAAQLPAAARNHPCAGHTTGAGTCSRSRLPRSCWAAPTSSASTGRCGRQHGDRTSAHRPRSRPDTISRLRDFVVRVFSLNNDADVRAVLRAVASRSNVRVLSTPEILAVNNREARIVVGDRVPFVASDAAGRRRDRSLRAIRRRGHHTHDHPDDQPGRLRQRADPAGGQPADQSA